MFIQNAKLFEEQLMKLINNSQLTISEAYYIVENAALQLKNVYLQTLYEYSQQDAETEEQIVVSADDNILDTE